MKILTWIMVNGASLVGVLQAIIKAVKEILTGIVNIASLFMSKENADALVATLRKTMNVIDNVLENIKGYLLKL